MLEAVTVVCPLQGQRASPKPEYSSEQSGLIVDVWVDGALVSCSALQLQEITSQKAGKVRLWPPLSPPNCSWPWQL